MTKADETLKRKCLSLIRLFPGTTAAAITKAQRRFLRALEAEGLIRYDSERTAWYPVEVKKENA